MSKKLITEILSNSTESKFWMDSLNLDLVNHPISEFIFSTYLLKMTTNFVKLTWGHDITVEFNSDIRTGCTDFKKIILNSNISNPDSVIGLALHEASHLKFSSPGILIAFRLFKNHSHYDLIKKIIENTDVFKLPSNKLRVDNIYKYRSNKYDKYDYAGCSTPNMAEYAKPRIIELLKDKSIGMWNWLEDRRIDSLMTDKFKGYRNYYISLYNKFFFTDNTDNIINTKLDLDDIFSNVSTSNLVDRLNTVIDLSTVKLYNFINPKMAKKVNNFDPITKKLWDRVDINNFGKNVTTEIDVMEMFSGIYDIIYDTLVDALSKVPYNDSQISDEPDEQQVSKTSQTPSESKTSNGSKSEDLSDEQQVSKTSQTPSESKTSNGSKSEDEPELKDEPTKVDSNNIDNLRDIAYNVIEDINNVIDPKKEVLNQLQTKILNSINNETIKIDKRDSITQSTRGTQNYGMLIEKVTLSNLDEISKQFSRVYGDYNQFEKAINLGFCKGKLLAKKISFRNDTKTVSLNRLKSGNITDRLISELPYNCKVFNTKTTIKYPEAYIHLSIDGSGSMSHQSSKVLTMAASLVAATKELKGIELKISYRSQFENFPLTVIIYDSKIHTLNDFKIINSRLNFASYTPEGLCYHSVLKTIKRDAKGKQAFLINISDGMPIFKGFLDSTLINYTKSIISKIEKSGVGIISYFIDERTKHDMFKQFSYMYGIKNSFKIAFDDLNKIGSTISNKLTQYTQIV